MLVLQQVTMVLCTGFMGFLVPGKTTVADRVYKEVHGKGLPIVRLDGDVVRENLTEDLGFS